MHQKPFTGNRVALNIHEPLAASAPLAKILADTHCSHSSTDSAGCDWYHGAWQFFRLLGLINTICSDDDFFARVLPAFCRDSQQHILISGAADYALLARIAAANADGRGCAPLITVLDRCSTPLLLNLWYAEQVGIPVTIQQTDILRITPRPSYDLVCTHSFLSFFDAEDRGRLVRNWFALLKPGGCVVTAQRVRPQEQHSLIGYKPNQIRDFGRRARLLATSNFASIGLDPSLAEAMAVGYAARYTTFAIRSVSELAQLFCQAGFVLREFSAPEHPGANDQPGAPQDAASMRWRIVAEKPPCPANSGDLA